jgi:hypothetical protein
VSRFWLTFKQFGRSASVPILAAVPAVSPDRPLLLQLQASYCAAANRRWGPEAVIPFRLSLVSPNIDRRLTSAMRRCGRASHYDRKFDVANRILDRQVSPVAGIDRYAIAIRIDQLEIVVTKKLVLSNCLYRHSLFQ